MVKMVSTATISKRFLGHVVSIYTKFGVAMSWNGRNIDSSIDDTAKGGLTIFGTFYRDSLRVQTLKR